MLYKTLEQTPEVFYKKCVFKNFVKSTRKHQCWSLLFNNIAGFRPEAYTFIKKTPTQVFSCEFCKIFKNAFLAVHFPVAASKNCFSPFLNKIHRDSPVMVPSFKSSAFTFPWPQPIRVEGKLNYAIICYNIKQFKILKIINWTCTI